MNIRLNSTKQWISWCKQTAIKCIFTCILARCVLYAAKISLWSNANAIILIWQLTANIKIKIETFHASINTSMVLQTARIRPRYAATFNLWYANAPHSWKRRPACYKRQHYRVAVSNASVNIHYINYMNAMLLIWFQMIKISFDLTVFAMWIAAYCRSRASSRH